MTKGAGEGVVTKPSGLHKFPAFAHVRSPLSPCTSQGKGPTSSYPLPLSPGSLPVHAGGLQYFPRDWSQTEP